MDPVSAVGLVASIIQLIDTTTKVIGYVNDVKDGPAERAQFARHASSLLALLFDLRYRAEESKSSSDPWFVAIRGLKAEGGPLDQLQDHMEQMATKLEPPTGRLKKVGKALTWTFNKKEIEAALTQIERVKSLVMLALQDDLFKLNLAMKEDLEVLRAARREAIVEQKDEEFEMIIAWLSSLDFASKQVDFSSRRHPGTGEWLLLDPGFQRWLEGEQQNLWCPGLPGAGKTTLAAMLIDWLESQNRGTVIYLYCSYKEEDIQTPQNMVGSLVKQIVQHKATLPDEVRALYKRHQGKKTRPKLDELARLLVQEVKTCPTVFVIIDALDECPERCGTRGKLLDEIQRLPSNTRVLITSRYSSAIEDRFENIQHIIIDIRATEEDVKRYVRDRAEGHTEKERGLTKHARSSPELMEDIITTIAERSRGMFLLAKLHMDSLAKKLTRREVRAALGALPKELDETYDQAMKRIQNQDEDRAALAHKVLYWISYSLRPLTVAELRHALAVQPGDCDLDEDGLHEPELLVSVCAGLVAVDEESHLIRLVHYTTQEYFRSAGKGRLTEPPSTIARTCLTYMSFVPFAERYCSGKRELEIRLSRYPFLKYAASYWGFHVRGGMEDDIQGLVLEYLGNNISILSAYQATDKRQIGFSYEVNGGRAPNWTRLHAAATSGLVDIAQILLDDGVDADARARHGTTPLHLAAAEGHAEVVHLLLREGAEVAPEATNRQTPLHLAAENGHEDVVRLLIGAGADCNDRRVIRGKSPLHLAIENRHINAARVLIEEGADVNQKDAVVRRRLTEEHPPEVDGGTVSDEDYDDAKWEDLGGSPLIRAVEVGDEAAVLLLLDNEADISTTDEKKRTALHGASQAGYVQIALLLIARGINVSAKDESGLTALHCAACRGQAEMVQVLLENNIDILAEDGEGRTAMHEAASLGHENVLKILLHRIGKEHEMTQWLATARLPSAVDEADEDKVRILLGKGADPNISSRGISLLHLAVARKAAVVLQLLLANGAIVGSKDVFHRTPLHWAAYRSYIIGARLLLDYGADIHVTDASGATPLRLAVAHGSASVVKQLLDSGARIDRDASGKDTALSWLLEWRSGGHHSLMDELSDDEGEHEEDKQRKVALWRRKEAKERLAVLDLLVENGADLNAPQRFGRTPLLSAIIRPLVNVPLIQRLVQGGADITAQDDFGEGALYCATFFRHTEVVRLLLESGADVNQANVKTGTTALQKAAGNGSEDIARLLIEAGADIHAINKRGSSALYRAVSHGCESLPVVDLLLANGVDINTKYRLEKTTVLHHAAATGNIAMVQCLLERGARIDAVDADGKTALDWAEEEGQEAMIFVLSSYEA